MTYDNFDEWLKAVDFQLDRETGLVSADFPDQCYWDNWDNGTSPREQAVELLESEGYFHG